MHNNNKKPSKDFYTSKGLPEKPDIIVIMTDQERYPAHWNGFENTLSSWTRLKQHGLTFNRAYTSACMCTPSRGVLLTSNYSNVTGLKMTPGTLSYDDPRIPQMANMLKELGYDVVWKGKWHLSGPADVMQWSPWDIQNMEEKYGFSRWNPPDAGTVTGLPTYESWATAGAGRPGKINPANDKRYIHKLDKDVDAIGFGESTAEFLAQKALERKAEPNKRKPFVLFLSLVNPHDINFFPIGWKQLGYTTEDFEALDIKLPNNAVDTLETKPTIQSHIRDILNEHQPLRHQHELTGGAPPLPGDKGSSVQPDPDNNIENYVKYYAYMTQKADERVNDFLDLVDKHGFSDDALIVRTSDHGEMGLSHGLREKVYNAYEETIHIPLVVSNKKLFANAEETDAFYGHVDFLPTLIDLAGGSGHYPLMKGNSLFPVINGEQTSVQDTVFYCYDDESAMISDLDFLCHLRAIRHQHYLYAVYYSPNIPGRYEYELYDLEKDMEQNDNLLHKPEEKDKALWETLHFELNQKMIEAGQKAFPPLF